MIAFRYFSDPMNFSYLLNEPQPCDCCGKEAEFDAEVFAGIEEIEAICVNCLAAGKLKALDIEANEAAFSENQEALDIIRYCTPTLPCWQSKPWPCINGEYPRFERIASQVDFSDIEDFKQSFSVETLVNTDIAYLWETMSNTRLTCMQEGGDISVYLFTLNGHKHCIWDAN